MGDVFPAAAVGHESVMPDFMKSGRQHVPQKSFDKLRDIKSHLLPVNPAFPVIFVTEPDLVLVEADQAMIADGHPVGIAADVVHDLVRFFKRGLAVYHPLAGCQLI